MNKTEGELAGFFAQNHIDFVAHDDVPPLQNEETGREHRPDFFLPRTKQYVEVKGRMDFHDIRKVGPHCRSYRRVHYYLYQVHDPDWDPQIEDWPPGVLPATVAHRMVARAKRAASDHLARHQIRETKSNRAKQHEMCWKDVLQRQEILHLAKTGKAARASSHVTHKRLWRYLDHQLDQIGAVGLLQEPSQYRDYVHLVRVARSMGIQLGS